MSRTYIAYTLKTSTDDGEDECDENSEEEQNQNEDGQDQESQIQNDSESDDEDESEEEEVEWWRNCFQEKDFDIMKFDVEQVKIFGVDRDTSWLRPTFNMECSLSDTDAYRFDDKQVLHKLEGKNHTRGRYNWLCFTFGITQSGIVMAYARVKAISPRTSLANYRKTVFENYVFKALLNVANDDTDRRTLKIPTNNSFQISPEVWPKFSRELDRLLKAGLPANTSVLSFGLLIDKLNEDVEFSNKSLCNELESYIDVSSKSINSTQIHFVCSFHVSHQLVTCDFDNIKTIFNESESHLHRFFHLKRHGGFTTTIVKIPDYHEVSSVKFQFENSCLLDKTLKLGKCSLFANAVLGDLTKQDLIEHVDLKEELLTHRENILKLKDEMYSFIEGLQKGSISRFEAVFSADGLHPELNIFNESSTNQSLFDKFTCLTEKFLHTGLVVRSTGNWWIKHCIKFQRRIIDPMIDKVFNISEEKPLTRIDLKQIYDRENIFLAWSCGDFSKWVDKDRLNFLKSITPQDEEEDFVILDDDGTLPSTFAENIVVESALVPNQKPYLFGNHLQNLEYEPFFIKYMRFLVEKLPENDNQKQHFNKCLFSSLLEIHQSFCYYVCGWEKCSENENLFSSKVFDEIRQSSNKKKNKKPVVFKNPLTSWSILESILFPKTLFGQMSLITVMNLNEIKMWRTEKVASAQEIVKRSINYFPGFLCDSDEKHSAHKCYNYFWYAVNDDPVTEETTKNDAPANEDQQMEKVQSRTSPVSKPKRLKTSNGNIVNISNYTNGIMVAGNYILPNLNVRLELERIPIPNLTGRSVQERRK